MPGARIALNLAPVDSRIESYPLAKLSLLIVNRVEAQSVAGREQIGDALAKRFSFTARDGCIVDGR